MREDTKRLRNEAREFDEAVMNDKEPTVMPKDYCVECGNFECECKCPTCKGTGTVVYAHSYHDIRNERMCLDCNGKG